jgi:nitroreductase
MIFSKPITEVIEERTSWRTYLPKPIGKELKTSLKKLLELKNLKNPFEKNGGKCRFKLIGIPEFDPHEKKKLGTYGIIKGAQEFIVGAVEKSEHDRKSYGYMMEYIILGATDLGLGTCWLGGFFNRSVFSAKINATADEIVPAITPIGYCAEKRRITERVIRRTIKADNRFPWEQLFFERDFSNPLRKENAGKYDTLLEMVHLGPSAGNKQPWRIAKDVDSNVFHFYIVKPKGRYEPFPPLDIGIAVCHWDLTAKELEFEGEWDFTQPNIRGSEKFEYVISWCGL